jgi:tetratricopeptide (TPR) repeat protein
LRGELREMLLDVTQQRIDALEKVEPGVPLELAAIVRKAMLRDPQQRYRDAGQLVQDLKRFQAGQLVGAHHYSPWTLTRRWLSRHRQRIAGSVAVAVVAVGLVLSYRAIRHDRRLLCRGAETRLAGIWDEGRKRAAHDAFVASRLPYAEMAFANVARTFDAYAQAWVAMHTEACEATRVRGEQSEDLLDRRMECLDERLQEAKAQIELFTSADGQVVEKSAQMVSSLSSLAGCSDVAALREPLRPPADAATRARIDGVHAELARAAALNGAGKYKEAQALVGPPVAEARAIAYRPLEAEALVTLGKLQFAMGDHAAAEKALQEGLLAARAGRASWWEVRGAATLVIVEERLAHYDQAHAAARYGFAAFEALGASDARDERPLASLLISQGTLLAVQARYDEALANYRRALAIREKADGPDDASVAMALEGIGFTLGKLGRYAEAETQLRRDLAINEKQYGPEHPAVARALLELGFVTDRQGRHDEALADYRRNVAIMEKALGRESERLALPLTNIADILRIQGKYDEALAVNRRSFAISEKALGPGHPNVALALNNVGDVLRIQGKLDEAAADYRRALAIWEKRFGPEHPDVAVALTGLGRTLLDQRQAGKALAMLERALAIRLAHPGDPTELQETRFALARALWETGSDRGRARELAAQARAGYVQASAEGQKELPTVDAWLAAHR